MQQVLTICDCRCLKVVPVSLLFAGIGNELHSFSANPSHSRRVLCKIKTSIHGIDFSEDRLLLFSENTVFIYEKFKSSVELITKSVWSDWISSAVFTGTREILLLTRHSVALLLEFNDAKDSEMRIKSKQSCVEKSTIYASYINGRKFAEMLIFSGTALGEVFFWMPGVSNAVLGRFKAHNGSVFSIDFSTKHSLLITSSDDRSVCYWNFSFNNELLAEKKQKSLNIMRPHRKIFGHSARVFRAKIFEITHEKFIVASIGEDSNICLWNENGELLFKKRQHCGAIIWDVDFSSELRRFYTGGSDGSIQQLDLNEALQTNIPIEIKLRQYTEEQVCKLKFMNTNLLLMITHKNNLILKNLETNMETSYHTIPKCTVLKVQENGKRILLGCYRKILTFNLDINEGKLMKESEITILESMIRSIICLNEEELLICDEMGNCILCNMKLSTQLSIHLPQSKDRWLTAAMKLGNHLFVSNRQGHLIHFLTEKGEFQIRSIIKQVHGPLGVTHMRLIKEDSTFAFIETCGHDSSTKIIKIEKTSGIMKITQTRNIPITWIEGVVQRSSDHSTYVYGFSDNHFIVCETVTAGVIFKSSCGGGHRCWDLVFNFSDNCAYFVYIKTKKAFCIRFQLPLAENPGMHFPTFLWHKKVCNTLQVISYDSSKIFMFSGGEDNILKVSRITIANPNDSGMATELAEVQNHISSIKTISVYHDVPKDDCLVFSAGGRTQLCITKFNIKTGYYEELFSQILSKLKADTLRLKKSQKIDFDPETRITAMDIMHENGLEQIFDVFLACSDGTLWKALYESYQLKLVKEVIYKSYVTHMKCIKTNDNIILIVTAANCGVISFWTTDFQLCFELQHHESGVNAFDTRIVDGIRILILTGGDDQSVVFSEVHAEKFTNIKLIQKFRSVQNTAQVNGAQFSQCAKFAYTASIDQYVCKLKLPSLELVDRYFSCVPATKGVMITNHNALDKHFCLVYGSGFQIIDL